MYTAVMDARIKPNGYGSIFATLCQDSTPAVLPEKPQHDPRGSHPVFFKNPNPFATPTKGSKPHADDPGLTGHSTTASNPPLPQRSLDTTPLIIDSPTCTNTFITSTKDLSCTWSRLRHMWYNFWGARRESRRLKEEKRRDALNLKRLKEKKRRYSAEQTKAVDTLHQQQIMAHRERERRRNSEARRQAKEQRREVRMKEHRRRSATKALRDAQEKEDKEMARAVGLSRTRSAGLWIRYKINVFLT